MIHEDVRAYKPAPEVHRLAVDAVGCPPERVLMVAAHAWDLRGAQAVGLRTDYVQRPVDDPPTGTDTFDWRFGELDELINTLTEGHLVLQLQFAISAGQRRLPESIRLPWRLVPEVRNLHRGGPL